MTEQQATGSPPVPICYRHPGRETYVRCTRCDRPICPDCMNEASVGFQCPECVGAARRTTRAPRTVFGGGLHGDRGYVTIGLIVVNVLVFLATLAVGGVAGAVGGGGLGIGGEVTSLTAELGISTYQIGVNGEYWRLVTAMFVHFGVLHLLMNMWALWVLGRYLERALGPARFAALYFVCGFGGNVAVYVFGGPGLSGGASTAVFGLFAAMFFINRKLGLSTSGVVVLIVINLIFTFTVPNISILGHIGGLVTGVAAGLGLAYAPRHTRTPVQAAVLGGLFLLLLLLAVARTAMILSTV